MSFVEISAGLDRLFFSPFASNETTEQRAETIELFLKSNGWDWERYLDRSWEMNWN